MGQKEEPETLPDSKEITPLKDWRIVHNEHDIQIKEGEKIRVPRKFLDNLKTEKVIE